MNSLLQIHCYTLLPSHHLLSKAISQLLMDQWQIYSATWTPIGLLTLEAGAISPFSAIQLSNFHSSLELKPQKGRAKGGEGKPLMGTLILCVWKAFSTWHIHACWKTAIEFQCVCVCVCLQFWWKQNQSKSLRGQCGPNANLANGGIREQRWRFQAKCLSDSVLHKMGWNSQEKDKRMKRGVRC